jgi:hypothetical protein
MRIHNNGILYICLPHVRLMFWKLDLRISMFFPTVHIRYVIHKISEQELRCDRLKNSFIARILDFKPVKFKHFSF